MSSTIVTLRPSGNPSLNGWTIQGGAASGQAAVSDNSDSTGVQFTASLPDSGINFTFPGFSLPAGAVVQSLTLRVRIAMSLTTDTGLGSDVYLSGAVGHSVSSPGGQIPGSLMATTLQTLSFNAWTTRVDGKPWQASDLAALTAILEPTNDYPSSNTTTIAEVYLDIAYNQAPTATATAPAGTVTNGTRPLVTWTYSDPEADAQERYWVKVFTSAQSTPDTPSAAPIYDTGETYSNATSVSLPFDVLNGTFYAYVKVADAGSGGRYSPWSSTSWTQSVTYPAAPTLTATLDQPNARAQLAVSQGPSPGGYTSVAIIVESSDDVGVTWAQVRSSPVASPAVIPASPAITSAGALQSATASPAANTLSLTTHAVGNLVAVAVETKFAAGQNYSCTGLSGGGVTTWTKAGSFFDTQGIHEISIWFGTVTAAGTATLTATYSNSGTVSTTINAAEFSSSAGVTWTLDVFGSNNDAASTTPHYPALSAAGADELYFGFIQWPGSGSAGSTPGFTYTADSNGNQVAWNVNVSGTVQPTASSASQISTSAAVLIIASLVAPGSGTVNIYDYEMHPGVPRIYRARPTGIKAGLTNTGPNVAGTGTITFTPTTWILKDVVNPSNNMIGVSILFTKETRVERLGVFYALGRKNPIVVGDAMSGWDGTATLSALSFTDKANIEALLSAQNPLLLQSRWGESRYIRTTQRTRQRKGGFWQYPVTFVEVDMPPLPALPASNVPVVASTAGSGATGGGGSGGGGGTLGPSGIAMPNADLTGWHLIFNDDFNVNVAQGQFPSSVSDRWAAYPWGPPPDWHDTSGNGFYDPSIISQSGSCLNIDLQTLPYNGVQYHRVAAPSPILPGLAAFKGQLYGRYAACFQAPLVPGYKTAWLLWPDSDNWPTDGEIDFPEATLQGTSNIEAFMHWQGGTSGSSQDSYSTAVVESGSGWHVVVIEWSAGLCTFYLDGVQIGQSTGAHVPNTPMHYILQTETATDGTTPANSTQGIVQIDWVAIWSKV